MPDGTAKEEAIILIGTWERVNAVRVLYGNIYGREYIREKRWKPLS